MKTTLIFVIFLFGAAYATADTAFVTVSQPGNTINSITGDLGGRFINRSGETTVITSIGRWIRTGNSGSHTLKIWNSSRVLIDSVSVNASGAPANAFLYGTLPLGPVNVAPGDSVYITSTESAGSELLSGPNLQSVSVTDIGAFDQATLIGGTWTVVSNENRTFGPVNFQYSSPVPSWTYDPETNEYTTSGTYYQVASALRDSPNHPGSTVNIGAVTSTWFVGGGTLTIPAGITLSGDTAATTIINMSTGSVSGFSVGSIILNEGSVVREMTINGPDAANCVPLITTVGSGTWRVSRINYNQYSGRSSYFINIQKAPSGLIDNCVIMGAAGTSELIFSRGVDTAWQNPSGIGDSSAVYIEANTFGGVGQGYINDANDNGKVVIRFNTITGGMKADGHGRASNSIRGVRRMEIYGNTWTYNSVGGWLAIEARGGKNIIFNNVATIAGQGAGILLRDYGYLAMYGGFLYRYQTPYNYPLLDQIGLGEDETIDATEADVGDLVQIASLGTTNFMDYGASSNTPGIWFFVTAVPTGTGQVVRNSRNDPSYVFGNLKNGSSWARTIGGFGTLPTYATNSAGYSAGVTSVTLGTMSTTLYANNAFSKSGDTTRYLLTNTVSTPPPKTITFSPGLTNSIPASATTLTVGPNTLYQYQTGNPSATFTESDIVQSNRDFYSDAGFDTNTGVTVGTAAQKNATSAVGKQYQGFWVTDEGTWNTENNTPGTPGYQKGQGQLYVSNGTNWVLAYTPYTYPYINSGPAPAFTSSITGRVTISGKASLN